MKITHTSTNGSKYPGKCIGGLLFASLLLLAGSAVAKEGDAAPAPKDLRQFFKDNCSGCHGADGSARDAAGKSLSGEDFTDAKWRKSTKDDSMVNTILKGKFFGFAMPAYKDKLTKDEALQMLKDVLRKCEKGKAIEPAAKPAAPAQGS